MMGIHCAYNDDSTSPMFGIYIGNTDPERNIFVFKFFLSSGFKYTVQQHCKTPRTFGKCEHLQITYLLCDITTQAVFAVFFPFILGHLDPDSHLDPGGHRMRIRNTGYRYCWISRFAMNCGHKNIVWSPWMPILYYLNLTCASAKSAEYRWPICGAEFT
jgi:hypothetical protein